MHYERGAKKILRFFREEFHKVRFQKIEECPRGGGEVRQRRRADLDDLRRVERQDAHAARPSAAIERVVHGEAETGLDHRVGRKGIHRGKFEIRRDAAARENARVEDFANSFGDSGSAATSVLVAQNRGAGKEERVKESFRSSLFLMLAMGLAMSLIMYSNASTSVGFMLGTRSGAAFDKFCEVSPLIEMRGKGMTFLRKHEVFAHMGKPCRKRKTFVRDALCLLNFCKVKLFYNSSKW
ncbi:hypothetical protein EGR95_09375 [bacterium]|nr:hypothetical protein [bacterium]